MKILKFVLITFIFNLSIIFAERSNWINNYSDEYNNEAFFIQEDWDGNLYLAGNTYSSNNNSMDLWVAKLSKDGDIVWQKCYGNEYNESFVSLYFTEDNNLILLGIRNYDPLIIKISKDGNFLWERIYFMEGYQFPVGLQVIEDGYLVFGTSELVFLMKIDFEGNFLWCKKYQLEAVGGSIALGKDGSILLTGSSCIDGSICLTWLLKIDKNGNVILYKESYTGIIISSIIPENDGYILAGYSNPASTICFSDLYFAKIDLKLNTIWQTFHNIKDCDRINSAILSKDGNLIATGFSSSFSQYDLLILKVDKMGNIIWDKLYNFNKNSYGYFINYSQDGEYFVAGYTKEKYMPYESNILLIKFNENGEFPLCDLVYSSPFLSYNFDVNFYDDKVSVENVSIATSSSYLDVSYSSLKKEQICFFNYESSYWMKLYEDNIFNDFYNILISESNEKSYILISNYTDKYYSYNIIFLKVNEYGDIIWQKSFERQGDFYLEGKTETKDGNFIIFGGDNSSNDGKVSSFIIKLDKNANFLWGKKYISNYENIFESIKEVDDGYIAVGTKWLDEKSFIFILKLDFYGNIIWEENYLTGQSSYVFDIIKTNDGGYLLLGGSYNLLNENSLLLLKLNSFGKLIWAKNYYGQNYLYGIKILNSKMDYIVFANVYYRNKYGFLIFKIDNSGNMIWKKFYENQSFDSLTLYDIYNDLYDKYLLSGYGSKGTDNSFHYYIWISQIEKEGNIIWEKTYGNENWDFGASIKRTLDGEIIVGGCSYSSNGINSIEIIKTNDLGEINQCPLMSSSKTIFYDINFYVKNAIVKNLKSYTTTENIWLNLEDIFLLDIIYLCNSNIF